MDVVPLLILLLPGCVSPADPVDQFLTDIGFSGAALVVQSGEIRLQAGYGFAERELGVPNTPDGVFRIGSLTKPVTSSALLRAVDNGSLRLESPVCDFLRVCPEAWAGVELHHLLAHTSGIPDLFGALPSAPVLETRAVIDELLENRGEIALRTPPGTAYAYSNFNYMLAGYVLEVATGVSWESFLRDSLLLPVGAVNTRYDDAWTLIEGRVRGYRSEAGQIRPIEYKDHSAYAAGGLLSTVDDLRRWHEAFVAGRIVSDSLVTRATTAGLGDYGLGWQVIEALGRPLHNHTGGISGFTSHLAWYPTEEVLIVLLSNLADENVKALACDVARLVFDEPELPSADPTWLERPTAERCQQRSLL